MKLPIFDEMFKQIIKNLWLCGIPYGRSMRFWYYILMVLLALQALEELLFFISRIAPENFLELTALAPCIGIGILSMIKIHDVAGKMRQIFSLTERLRDLYKTIISDSKKKKIVAKYLIWIQKFTKFFFVLNVVLISVYSFSILFIMLYDYVAKGKVKFILAYEVLVPFRTDIWPTWLLTYSHSVACGFICVLYFTTVDALYFNLSSHVCIHFTVLSDEIQNLKATNGDLLAELVDLVKRHQYLLRLSEDLEEIFTAINLYNVMFGSIEICALGFNIMTADWTTLPGFLLFILSELVQIFVMSVFGENLLRESGKVSEAAYLCEWYQMDQKFKNIILNIMTRANKPQRLTAYKFSIISYESFTKIISTSWSYFTILRTVYNSSEEV